MKGKYHLDLKNVNIQEIMSKLPSLSFQNLNNLFKKPVDSQRDGSETEMGVRLFMLN